MSLKSSAGARDEEVKWFVIVNPTAGGGRGLDHFPQISKHLRDAHILCEPVFTEHKFHATELTVTAVREGYRHIIVVGGDGTLHEVVNGLFIQQEVRPEEVLLAVIAVGTGNDWVRTFGMSDRYQHAVRAIAEGFTFLQDVGVVSYEESHYRQSRYMANVAGAGFDAHVVQRLSHLKKKGHKSRWRYTWCLIRNFFRYKPTGVKVWVDGRLVYNNLLLSAAVGICKFNGGGIQQLPEAVADDGILDLSLIRPVHFWHLLFRFHYLFNGGIYRIRHILQERGSSIRIESSPEVGVEVDGELVTELGTRVDPKRQQVRVDGSRIRLNPRHITLALNKPRKVLSTMDDPKGRYTLRDIVGDKYERIFHMGRLDYDSEGLILMTNDGELSQHVMHPKYEVEKTYVATLEGKISGTVCRRLVTTGVQLDDGWIKLDHCAIIDSSRDHTMVKVVLHSGKNRIVRRIFGSIGFPVKRLVRTQIGPIKLGDLKPGSYRVLSQTEVRSLSKEVGL